MPQASLLSADFQSASEASLARGLDLGGDKRWHELEREITCSFQSCWMGFEFADQADAGCIATWLLVLSSAFLTFSNSSARSQSC